MTIVYDLRFASDHFAGIGTHAFALLDALLGLPGEERYVVLWDPGAKDTRHDLEPISRHPRVRWVERRWPPLDPFDGIRLGAWLRAERPSVYLSPFYLRPLGARCPVVLTIHDVWPMRLSESLGIAKHLLYRLAMLRARSATAILTSSRFSRDEIVSLIGADATRVHAIPLGRAPHRAFASASPPAGLPGRAFALVVGDNRPRKNLVTLARSWASFGDTPPLALVGVGPVDRRYPDLAALARRMGAKDVHALGWVGEGELEWLYDHAVVTVFPSRYEGFGFPLVEALAHGSPVVAADTETFREVGADAVRYASVDDPGAWAREVSAIADWDTGARDEVARKARARARELDYAATARRTMDLLHGLVERSREHR